MQRAFREDASFRDPSGNVFVTDDRVFRSVSDIGAADYEFVRDSGFHQDLVAKRWLVESDELEPSFLEPTVPAPRYLLEHPKLPFISYPYEWCFSAMRSAALLQLDLLLEGLDRNITLSDASAYNIQFRGPEPIFIDVLSFRRYNEGDYWLAHRQFCEQFLNPLLLTATRGIAFNAWFRGSLED